MKESDMPMGHATQPISSVRWVHRDTLIPNDYNPNHVAPVEMRLLKRSIMKTGWTQPIVVLDDWKTIVDGFHRWTCSGDPKIAALTGGLVPVVSCGLSVEQRIAATVRHNRARGTHAIDPMGDIIEKLRSEGLDDKAIGEELGMEQEEVARLTEVRSSPTRVSETERTTLSNAWAPGNKPVRSKSRKTDQ
jgi:ParB-like chromosome segregation protein Spo0J